MLAHKLLAQSITNLKSNRSVALVETDSDYVIAKGYRGADDCWEQGYYFPKAVDNAYSDAVTEYKQAVLNDIEQTL